MSLDFWYWLILAIWFFFGSYRGYTTTDGATWRTYAPTFGINLALLLLLIIIGVKVFGNPLDALVK